MLDNPFAFMLIFTIATMCVSALLGAATGKDIFDKIFWASVFVFMAWIALSMFMIMFSVAAQ